MIAYIKGTLTDASPVEVVIETGGIGYQIHIPVSHYSKLPRLGESLCLFISSVLREDSHKYYGFLTKEERSLFEDLIATSGIGPKTGLALLGHLEPADLQMALSQSDIPRICKVPGIGKKTAERLIVEMRDRMKSRPLPLSPSPSDPHPLFHDALSALTHLGYPPPMIHKTLQAIIKEQDQAMELSELITLAIKKL